MTRADQRRKETRKVGTSLRMLSLIVQLLTTAPSCPLEHSADTQLGTLGLISLGSRMAKDQHMGNSGFRGGELCAITIQRVIPRGRLSRLVIRFDFPVRRRGRTGSIRQLPNLSSVVVLVVPSRSSGLLRPLLLRV
jgi:hypothetical protein